MRRFPQLLFVGGLALLVVAGSIRFLALFHQEPQYQYKCPPLEHIERGYCVDDPDVGAFFNATPHHEPQPPERTELPLSKLGVLQQFVEESRIEMQILISVILLLATLFVILSSRYQPKDKHWAYSTLGMVVGFWLKT